MDWQGITLSVRFDREWLGVTQHLEVHVIHPEGAKLPITDTGYRSAYPRSDLTEYGGPVGYVRRWLDEEAAQNPQKWQQLSLF